VRELLRPEPPKPMQSRRRLLINATLGIVAAIIIGVALTELAVPTSRPTAAKPHLPYLRYLPIPPASRPPGLDSVVPVATSAPAMYLLMLVLLPLALRRIAPLASFWLVVVGALLIGHGRTTWVIVVACALAAYSAAAHSRYRWAVMPSLVIGAALAALEFERSLPGVPPWSWPFVVLLSVGGLGIALHQSRGRLRDSLRRVEDLKREQQDELRRAVEVERARIARELHDVVTHNVSVMVVQAGAARKVMDGDPEASRGALLSVESCGRAALTELRHVMGLLSEPAEPGPDGAVDLAPQPGLAQLGSLVERVRGAGITVTTRIDEPPAPLSPGVDLAAYRVVQEALTNSMKHAVGARCAVVIGHDDEWLEIDVTDTGGTHAPQAANGSGRGLIGLRERLAVYGGTLVTGHRLGGGYRVSARVPWEAT
jgi:signal transduction histidine kinase